MSEQLGIANKKENDFSEWYLEVVKKAELADYSPVEGCMIILPNGYAIWEGIQRWLDAKIKETGHKNLYFPTLIPERFLTREKEHVEGFKAEVAWVTHGGTTKLGEKLALRPTSETIMYDYFSKIVRSHRDLPLLTNQWANVFRWETKMTKPFLRTREFLWQEGHTVHATESEASEEVMKMLNAYKELCETQLAVPVITGKKTENEKFPGALWTTTIEALMPDGKSLQSGTSHNLGQNFSKMFGIEFLDENEKKQFAWQTSWGASTRLIGAVIMLHGDDKGMVMPPKVAPIQAVIVPIVKQENKLTVNKEATKIYDTLRNDGIRVHLDTRENYTPGFKYNEWEMKGVPLRIEIGPKDIEKGTVMVATRTGAGKEPVEIKKLSGYVKTKLGNIHDQLYDKALKFLRDNIHTIDSYKEFKKLAEKQAGFIRAGWCGDGACEEKIKSDTGATARVIPFSEEGKPLKKCVYCGEDSKHTVYFARAY